MEHAGLPGETLTHFSAEADTAVHALKSQSGPTVQTPYCVCVCVCVKFPGMKVASARDQMV